MVGLLLLQTILAAIGPVPAPLHKFPDGYIDRSVSVIVRDQTATIEYSAGMNDETMRQILEKWQSNSPAEKSNANESKAFPDRNTESKQQPATKTDLTNPEQDTPESTSQRVSGNALVDDTDEEFVKNDAQLMTEFQKLAAAKLKQNLKIACQNKPLNLKQVNVYVPAKRHMSLTIQFEFTLPPSGPNNLSIVDENFESFDGAVRYSLKGMGNAILASSNVAPILVRAKPEI